MIIGTCHFVSFKKAVDYYHCYSDSASPLENHRWVEAKVEASEIVIGPPKARLGEYLFVNDEGRYCVKVLGMI